MRKFGSFLLVATAIVVGCFIQSMSADASHREGALIFPSDNLGSTVQASEIGVDYSRSMTVGETQTLMPYVLPPDAVVKFTYMSSNDEVASVDSFGTIVAESIGSATITIYGGTATKSITITVVAPQMVTSIEVNSFNEKMKKGETQTISPILYPVDVDNQHISYSSSNENVATVSAGGTVNALNHGRTTITLTAGAATKTLDLVVYVPTEKMQVSESYLVMNPGQSHQISVSVLPSDADQNIVYRALNGSIASVTSNGHITAHAVGETSIIASNEDSAKVITVIVNERNAAEISIPESELKPELDDEETVDQALLKLIADTEGPDVITVTCDECSYITTSILRALYRSKKTLCVQAEKYIIQIHGKDIKNAENEFSTLIDIYESDYGISFTVNEKNNLPGTVEIEFLRMSPDYKHLHLYDEISQEHKELNSFADCTAIIDIAGEYVLTISPIRTTFYPLYVIIFFCIVVCIGSVIYILTKKRYWFW